MALPWQGAHPARNIAWEVMKFSSRIAAGGGQGCGHAGQAAGRRLHRASRVTIAKGGGWRGCWQWHGMSPEHQGGSGGRLCMTPSHVRAAQRAMLWIGAMCFGLVHGRSKVGARAGQ